MRKLCFLTLPVALALFCGSCGPSGPTGTFADVRWQLRCEVMRGCIAYPGHDVNGYNGGMDLATGSRYAISCNVTETPTTRTLTFTTYTGGFGLTLRSAQFSRAGGTPTAGGCTVDVQEDNRYTGACGGSPPTAMQPCQVNNVRFTTDVATGSTLITGNIYCIGIAPTADPMRVRELTTVGTDVASRTTPLSFGLYDCPGYTPD
jgi:hypothetical protein